MEKTLSMLASLVTIINFMVASPIIIKIPIHKIIPDTEIASYVKQMEMQKPAEILKKIQSMKFSGRLIITIILEAALSYLFGLLFRSSARARAGLSVLLFIVLSMISAWLSIFNIEYICIGGPVRGFLKNILLIILILVPIFIACLSAYLHIMELTYEYSYAEEAMDGIAKWAILFQISAFILIIISRWFS